MTNDAVDALGINGDEQGLLGRNMEIDRAGRDAGGLGHVAHGRRMIAAVGEMHGRRVQKGRPAVRLLLCGSGSHVNTSIAN